MIKKANYGALKPVLFDKMGRVLTLGLFKETATSATLAAPYTLEEWKQVYLDCNDPTEYTPAMVLVGDWGHWLAIRSHKKIGAIFDGWKSEVEVKVRAEAVLEMVTQSKQPNGTTAAKWLAEGSWDPKNLRGKTSKEKEKAVKDAMTLRLEEDSAIILGGE